MLASAWRTWYTAAMSYPLVQAPVLAAAQNKLLAEDRGLLTRLSLGARERYLGQPPWEATAESIRNFLYSFKN